MRSLSLRAAVATRMRLWDQIRRALRGPRQTQNLDLRPAHDPNRAEAARRKQHDRGRWQVMLPSSSGVRALRTAEAELRRTPHRQRSDAAAPYQYRGNFFHWLR